MSKLSEFKNGMYAYDENKYGLIYVAEVLKNGACKAIDLNNGFETLISSESANEDVWHVSLVNFMNIKPEHAKFANMIDVVMKNYIDDSRLYMDNAVTIADTENPIGVIDFWVSKLLESKDEIFIDFEIERNGGMLLPDEFPTHYVMKVIKYTNKFGALVMTYLSLLATPESKCSDIDVDIHVVNDFAAACYINAAFESCYIFPGVIPIVYGQHAKTAHMHEFNTIASRIYNKYDHCYFQLSNYGVFRACYSGDSDGMYCEMHCEDRLNLPDDMSVPWFIINENLIEHLVENNEFEFAGDEE